MTSTDTTCPLCGGADLGARSHAERGTFPECRTCALVFAPRTGLPGAEEERARYATHENDPGDPRYRAFLDRLARPLAQRLGPPPARGLDYGSGPGPTLSHMLREQGFAMEVWDPFFAPDPAPLGRTYDFVTCTEVVEHFHEPGRELARLDGLIRPGGWLAVMTEVLDGEVDFSTWWYVRDPTHVAFFAPATFEWIAERYGWRLDRPGRTVALFRKGYAPSTA